MSDESRSPASGRSSTPGEAGGAREQTLYGRKACWAVFTHRPQDILRVFHTQQRRQELAPLLKWAAAARIPYRELDEDGMRRVADATHHEGVAMAVRPRAYAAHQGAQPAGGDVWMALDRIDNPYNLGAILRTCAFFGIGTVLVGGSEPGGKVNGAAMRAAEGGAESLQLVACPDLAGILRDMALRGVSVVGLESDSAILLGDRPVSRPAVLVAGHEQEGLSSAVRAACSWVCSIPGQGSVSSLNVSVSVGVALSSLLDVSFARAHQPPRRAPEAAARGRPRPDARSSSPAARPSRPNAPRESGKPARRRPERGRPRPKPRG